MSARARRWWPIGLLALLGAGLVGHGLYLPLKAQVAQQLLERAWRQAQSDGGEPAPWPWADTFPMAKLSARAASYSIEQLPIEQLVLANASGRNLAFGPTHVPPSARPGERGHVVISGHRDTHFTWLQTLRPGDPIKVEGRRQVSRYEVIGHEIIDLRERSFLLLDEDLLSLVTCYPFDAISPTTQQRYVVHARRVDGPGGSGTDQTL